MASGSDGLGRLTTHVLDLSAGLPGAGISIELYRLTGDRRELVSQTVTNQDGRTDRPMLAGDQMVPGIYELVFHTSAYFSARGVALSDPPFLDAIPLRFGIANPGQHYHVPLLVSPFAYSTYRGS